MRTVRGDLLKLALQGQFDVVVHGCNCQCVMGKGIALAIKTSFPEAYEADLATPKGDASKLGSISVASVERSGSQFFIVNGYTQVHWRGQGTKANYEAIRSVMRLTRLRFSGMRIGYPRIGAGLAGGDWPTITKIIQEELASENHTLVEFEA